MANLQITGAKGRYWFGKSMNVFVVNDLKVNKNTVVDWYVLPRGILPEYMWRRSNDHKMVDENFHDYLASIARVYPHPEKDEPQAPADCDRESLLALTVSFTSGQLKIQPKVNM
ncbi:hypothetical protein TNCV_1367781 [Trichonephila clavipes]|nr:hypothetical protein TNCV_1367781 [Trichonephila clavipes]